MASRHLFSNMGCACAKERLSGEDPPKSCGAVEGKEPTLQRTLALQRMATLRPPRTGLGSGASTPRSNSSRDKTPRGEFVRFLTEPLASLYRLGDTVQESDNRKLISAEYIGTGQRCYINIYPKSTGFGGLQMMATLPTDADLLRRLDHPRILRTLEMLQDEQSYYHITEPFTAQLSDYFMDARFREEGMMAKVMIQVLAALNYCHRLGIVHGNINPRNILLKETENSLNVQITGFGEFDCLPINSPQNDGVFDPPEKAEGYNEKCDIWSCGSILYLYLSGTSPATMGENSQQGRSRRRSVLFAENVWTKASPEALQLITAMLDKHPQLRPTAIDSMNSPWFTRHMSAPSINSQVLQRVLTRLRQSHHPNFLQHLVMKFLLTRVLDSHEQVQATDYFCYMDRDKDGVLSEEELLQWFFSVPSKNNTAAAVRRIMQRLGHSNTLTFTSYLVAAVDPKKLLAAPNLRAVFNCLDKGGSGVVSAEQVKAFFGLNAEFDTHLKEFLASMKCKGEGVFDYQEFAAMMGSIGPK